MPLGEFEQIVLFALARRNGEGHGAAIVEEIETRAGRRVSPGALYTVLDRLEAKGMVESWIGDSTPERGGRRRKPAEDGFRRVGVAGRAGRRGGVRR